MSLGIQIDNNIRNDLDMILLVYLKTVKKNIKKQLKT